MHTNQKKPEKNEFSRVSVSDKFYFPDKVHHIQFANLLSLFDLNTLFAKRYPLDK